MAQARNPAGHQAAILSRLSNTTARHLALATELQATVDRIAQQRAERTNTASQGGNNG